MSLKAYSNGSTNSSCNGPITRFAGAVTCPICGGGDDDPRGTGKRCFGFLSSDRTYAHCTREELAGQAPYTANSETYAHKLRGPCACGVEHGTFEAAPRHEAIEKIFDYTDGGELIYQVVKFRPKTFRQRRPDGNGGWTWNLKGITPFLYGRDELKAADPAETAFVVEGEKDVDRLREWGLVATSNPMGALKWRDHYSEDLRGRHVVIVPDHDPADKKNGTRKGWEHAEQVARSVAPLAASVRVLKLPDLAEGQDISDWLNRGHSIEELKRLATEAREWRSADAPGGATPDSDPGSGPKPTDDNTPKLLPGFEANPHALARFFLAREYPHPDSRPLRFWRDEFHHWAESAYRPCPLSEVRAAISRVIEAEYRRIHAEDMIKYHMSNQSGDGGSGKPKGPPRPRDVTGRLVADVAQALTSLVVLNVRECPAAPAWIGGGEPPWPASEVLPARNGLIHLPSLVATQPCTVAPTPRFFTPYALDYDFDPSAPEPSGWMAFLRDLWPDDPESIATLQEWIGYLLTLDTSQQKILMLIGPKRSGKGTIGRVIRFLIGMANVVNPTLSGLATNFGAAPLIGKPAAIITDARISGRTDLATVVERLLAVSGEDSQTIDRKHKEAWTGNLPTRFMLISNELPRLNDSSGALVSRLIVLSLTRSFYDREDTGLTDRLKAELPGILLWAIEGWRRLRERGHFVQPGSGRELVEELEDLASPVGAFVKERCEMGPGRETPVDQLYKAWHAWNESKGRQTNGAAVFGRDLRAALPGLTTAQVRDGEGRIRIFRGVRLIPEPKINLATTTFGTWLREQIEGGNGLIRDLIQAAGEAGHLDPGDKGAAWNPDKLWPVARSLRLVMSEEYRGKVWRLPDAQEAPKAKMAEAAW